MKNQNINTSINTLHKKSKVDTRLLPGFDHLIQAWIKVHQQYFQPQDRETSFPYQERPQVSLLGTAAFFCNGISLQEWPLDKGSKRKGRNDLWLRLKSQSQTHDYFIEAKHNWIGLENKTFKRLKKLVDSATKSADKIPSEYADKKQRRLALAFASLTFPSKELSNSKKGLEKFFSQLDNFSEENGIGGWAAVWVNAASFFKDKQEGKHTSVGLVMLVKPLDGL